MSECNQETSFEEFNHFVEEYKLKNNFETYIETLLDIFEKNFFPDIAHDNVKNYLHKSILEKLELEYSKGNFLDLEHRIEENKLW